MGGGGGAREVNNVVFFFFFFFFFYSMVSVRLNGYIWITFQHQGFKELMDNKMSPAQSYYIPDHMSNCLPLRGSICHGPIKLVM